MAVPRWIANYCCSYDSDIPPSVAADFIAAAVEEVGAVGVAGVAGVAVLDVRVNECAGMSL